MDPMTKNERGRILRPRTRTTKKHIDEGWNGGWALGGGGSQGVPKEAEVALELLRGGWGDFKSKATDRGCSVPRLPFTLLQSQ